ncbi:MAG TPA: hypothetical protein VJN44_09240 [Roseateles sp.]|nr:hypothetical protein [Roseateles sp.]
MDAPSPYWHPLPVWLSAEPPLPWPPQAEPATPSAAEPALGYEGAFPFLAAGTAAPGE